jgi:hypothetical protein
VRSSNGKNIGATGKNSTAYISRETPWIANAYEKGSCSVDEDNKCIDMAIKEINELSQNVLDEINKLSDSIATSNGKQALFRHIAQGFRIENGDVTNGKNMPPNWEDFQFHKLRNADKLEAIRIFNESVDSEPDGIQTAFNKFVKEHQLKNKNN